MIKGTDTGWRYSNYNSEKAQIWPRHITHPFNTQQIEQKSNRATTKKLQWSGQTNSKIEGWNYSWPSTFCFSVGNYISWCLLQVPFFNFLSFPLKSLVSCMKRSSLPSFPVHSSFCTLLSNLLFPSFVLIQWGLTLAVFLHWEDSLDYLYVILSCLICLYLVTFCLISCTWYFVLSHLPLPNTFCLVSSASTWYLSALSSVPDSLSFLICLYLLTFCLVSCAWYFLFLSPQPATFLLFKVMVIWGGKGLGWKKSRLPYSPSELIQYILHIPYCLCILEHPHWAYSPS